MHCRLPRTTANRLTTTPTRLRRISRSPASVSNLASFPAGSLLSLSQVSHRSGCSAHREGASCVRYTGCTGGTVSPDTTGAARALRGG
eukprot:9270590-Pyramimonas_sp.AAC.1